MGGLNIMVFKRFEIKEDTFQNLTMVDNITHRKYGKFNQYERTQLEYLCNDLNIENQQGMDYDDNINNTIQSAIANERTTLGRNVLIQLAESLGIEI